MPSSSVVNEKEDIKNKQTNTKNKNHTNERLPAKKSIKKKEEEEEEAAEFAPRLIHANFWAPSRMWQPEKQSTASRLGPGHLDSHGLTFRKNGQGRKETLSVQIHSSLRHLKSTTQDTSHEQTFQSCFQKKRTRL